MISTFTRLAAGLKFAIWNMTLPGRCGIFFWRGVGDKAMIEPLATTRAFLRLFSSKSRKFLARVLEAAALEKAHARIDSLEEMVKEKDLLIEHQYFPYVKQFTPDNLFDWFNANRGTRPPKIHPKLTHPMFGICRIPFV
jgi:hypothetical protein